ncbi:subclass B1 metallo-beta-lactamase [Cesiribacter andamanensis]|uniref:beta-lactamase n=1 Tax=Cesiribacter andamanensis AMV16 TaxID=1279009 RepID=M7P2C9_9BACT|nr:subclass B1 metallo-beta-lactamase [Cesiribacter andamanensis]EMR04714.1 Beta-lactamase type II precursor [Cesiribacter andamanensis AMV16]
MHNVLISFLLLLAYSFSAQAQTFQPELEVQPHSKGVFVHISYQLYGGTPFPSNGLIVVGDTSVLLIDTPWDSLQSEQLVQWVANEIKKPIGYCVVTHSHADRTAGYQVMQRHGIPLVFSQETAALSQAQGRRLQGIAHERDTTLAMAGLNAEIFFPGRGHTADNQVVWLPAQQLLFGGCLVKSKEATSMGNVADADLAAWPTTIRQLYTKYPRLRYVVPGHQQWGDIQLLMHTLELLKKHTP